MLRSGSAAFAVTVTSKLALPLAGTEMLGTLKATVAGASNTPLMLYEAPVMVFGPVASAATCERL